MKRSYLPLAGLFLLSGISHFVSPELFVRAVPRALPRPDRIVTISGGLELLGATGLLVPRTRRAAAYSLAALLVGVFPANVSMARNAAFWPGIPSWALWARLPLQVPLVLWALHAARSCGGNRSSSSE